MPVREIQSGPIEIRNCEKGVEAPPHPFVSYRLYQGSTIACSIGAIGNQKGRNRHNQYLRVQSHRPIARIERVTRDALVVGRCTAAANLPEPGDARPASQIGVYGAGIPDKLFLGNRARSYDAHLAPKDVK